jgi:hypothetical protein
MLASTLFIINSLHLDGILANHRLFPGKTDAGHLAGLQNSHEAVLAAMGKEYRKADPKTEDPTFVIYDFRHTFATRMAKDGCDIATLAKILGHGNLRSVQKYIHIDEEPQPERPTRRLTRVFLQGPLRSNERVTLLLSESAPDAVSVSLPDLGFHPPQLIQTSVGQGALGGSNTVGLAPGGNPLNELPALVGDLASDFLGVEKAPVPTTFTGAQHHSDSAAWHCLFRPTGTDFSAPSHRLHSAMFDLCRQARKVRF